MWLMSGGAWRVSGQSESQVGILSQKKKKKKEGQKPFSQLVHNQDRAPLKIDPDGQLL